MPRILHTLLISFHFQDKSPTLAGHSDGTIRSKLKEPLRFRVFRMKILGNSCRNIIIVIRRNASMLKS